jgi:16S rRNA (cytosine967-C5)-methyltransferase
VTLLDLSGCHHFFKFLAHKPHLRLAPEGGKAFIPIVLTSTPRAAAAQALLRREHGGGFIESLLDEAIAEARLSPPDRALCRELGLGCVRWQGTLDWLIAKRTAGRDQKPTIRILLRLGLYQLLWLDRVPAHAAVHESVELARQFGCGPQSGFVNAVLRGYARDSGATRQLLGELKSSQPSVGWSHPSWLIDRWASDFGKEEARVLLNWNNTPADLYARINTLKLDPGRLLERWRHENVDYEFVSRDWLPDNLVFRFKSHPPLAKLASLREGGFYVQDPSTLLAPLLLDPQPGESVLDLCAAPGGKATFMAQLMKDEGRIIACDTSSQRLDLLRENCVRLGTSCVVSHPAGAPLPAEFDRVLIDAPCSNTGVLRRRVDLRWRIKPGELQRLTAAQLELLRRAAGLVKPGGSVVYSTCSIEAEENSDLVRRFLAESPTLELEDEQALNPVRDQVDGAYAASLKRVR